MTISALTPQTTPQAPSQTHHAHHGHKAGAVDALDADNSTDSTDTDSTADAQSASDSFLLSLSPEAQDYLKTAGLIGNTDPTNPASPLQTTVSIDS